MKNTSIASLLTGLLIFLSMPQHSYPGISRGFRQISPQAQEYLSKAVQIILDHTLRRGSLDEDSFREKVFTRAAGAQSPSDTYPAIEYAIKLLGDRHSFLSKPTSPPKKDNKKNTSPFVPPLPECCMRTAEIACLKIPIFSGFDHTRMKTFAELLQRMIAAQEAHGARAWIVDLRENGGGNMWPMLAGLGPLLGDEIVGSFALQGKTLQSWFYKDGGSGMIKEGEYQVVSKIESSPYFLKQDIPPIAVLTGGNTASSGEAVLVTFRGRERTRTFGTATYGVPTANKGYPLGDGATLVVAGSYFADRKGHVYSGPVAPDVEIKEEDRVFEAATTWLKRCIDKTE